VFAAKLPPNSLVVTHNPNMFHIWGVSAAQMSLVGGDPRNGERYFSRYAGGVYLHWNFWCNVHDQIQNAFCRNAVDEYDHEVVDSRRERDYEYILYRLRPRAGQATPPSTTTPP